MTIKTPLTVPTNSFGVLMWVMYTRQLPYSDFEKQWDIPRFVCKGGREQIPTSCPDIYAHVLADCWDPVPEQRPKMREVIDRLGGLEGVMSDTRIKAKGGMGKSRTMPLDDHAQHQHNHGKTWQGDDEKLDISYSSSEEDSDFSDEFDPKGKSVNKTAQ